MTDEVTAAPPDRAAALALVEGIPRGASIALALVDPDGTLLSLSPSLAAMAGAGAGDHAGRPLRDVLPAELAGAVRSALPGLLRTGRSLEGLRVHGRGPGAAGRAWDVDLHRLDADGTVVAGLIVTDMSISNRASVALEESERQLAAAQRIAGMGSWTWTAASGAVRLSPELADVLGLDRRRAARLSEADLLELIAGDDRAAARDELRSAIAERRPFRFRQRVRHGDGSLRLIESEGEAVADARGRVAALRGIGQDITTLERVAARRHAVAELGRLGLGGLAVGELLDHARTLVADALWTESVTVQEQGSPDAGLGAGIAVAIDTPRRRFGELRVQVDVARTFDADEIAFLDSVAHVLGEAIDRRETATEIAALAASRGRLVGQALNAEDRARRSISERLHDGPLQDLLAAAHELYAASESPEAHAAQERLRTIARELREVMASLHPTVLRYGGLRAALVAVAEQQARVGGFEAVVAVDEEAADVHDELLLSVARHLLSNAARHAAAARVTVTLGRTAAGLRLEVADDGCGIPAGALEGGPDAGRLGLATSAERVAAVGGRLDASARPEGGTRVVVELPGERAETKS